MRRALFSGVAAASVLLLGTATGADAQASSDGWWTWALPQVAQAAQDEGGLSIPEILERARQNRERGQDARGERDRDDDYEYEDERYEDDDERGRDARRGIPGRRGGDERYDPRRAPRQGDYRGAENGRRGGGPPFCRNGEGHPVHGWDWCVEKGWAQDGYYNQGRYQDRRDGGWLPTRWEDVILGSPTPRRSGERMAEPTLADILGGVIMGRLAGHRDRIGASGDLSGRWLLENGARILQVRSGHTPLAELTDLDADGRADVVLLARNR